MEKKTKKIKSTKTLKAAKITKSTKKAKVTKKELSKIDRKKVAGGTNKDVYTFMLCLKCGKQEYWKGNYNDRGLYYCKKCEQNTMRGTGLVDLSKRGMI